MFRIAIALLAGLFCASGWAATYVYNGNNYSVIVTGTTYNTGMRITGSFSTASPLPANLSSVDIGPTGSNLVQSWNFNDGVNTDTPANSYILPSGSAFVVSTDAVGNITSYSIAILSPLPPHVIGSPMSAIVLSAPGGAIAVTGGPCTTLNGTTCTDINGALATGGAFADQGTFTLAPPTATSVPTLTEWNLLLLGGLLVLTAVVVVRRRQAA